MVLLALLLTVCVALGGCGGKSSDPAPTPTPGPSAVNSPAAGSSAQESSVPASAPEEGLASAGEDAPTLPPEAQEGIPSGYPGDCVFIGTKAGGFAASPSMLEEDQVTPEALIARIAELTGWDLTLAEPVTTGKGGMSVCLASTSGLFTGPPEPQMPGYHVYSAEDMAEHVLDSIQKTLQWGFTGEGGDPDSLDIYFYMEGEEALSIPNIGFSWPLDEPYQWANATIG